MNQLPEIKIPKVIPGFYRHAHGGIFWVRGPAIGGVLIDNGLVDKVLNERIMNDLTLIRAEDELGFAVVPEDLQCGLYYSPELDLLFWLNSSNFLFSTIDYKSKRRCREREVTTGGLRKFIKDYGFTCLEEPGFDVSPYVWIRKDDEKNEEEESEQEELMGR